MNKAIRSIRALSVILTLGFLLIACGDGSTEPDTAADGEEQTDVGEDDGAAVSGEQDIEPGDLEVVVLWPEGTPPYEAVSRVGDSLEEDFPGTEVTFTLGNTEARPRIELRWESGNPPDVDTEIFNGQNPQSFRWVEEDRLLELTESMEATDWGDGMTWREAILPGLTKFLSHDDGIYSAPNQAVVMGLYYNKALFEEHGVEPPETWDDLMDVCGTLRGAGVSPIAVTGTFEPYMGLWWDHLTQREVGADAVNDVLYGGDSAALTEDDGFMRAAEKLQGLRDEDCLLDNFEGVDFTAAQTDFFQGRAGMILVGSWLVVEMQEAIPEGFELGIIPFPAVEGGEGDPDSMFGTVLSQSVAAESEDQALAIEFLRRFNSQEEQTRQVEETGIVSPYQGVPVPAGVDGLQDLVEQSREAELTYYYYGTINNPPMMEAWYGPVARLLFGDIDAEEMLESLTAVGDVPAEAPEEEPEDTEDTEEAEDSDE